MSSPGKDADTIRNKRLAKLQAASPAAVPYPSTASSQSPLSSPGKITGDVAPSAKSSSPAPSSEGPSAQSQVDELRPKYAPSQSSSKPPQSWEDKSLGQIFKVALYPSTRASAAGHSILEDLRQGLEQDDPNSLQKGVGLTVEALDQVILEVCTGSKVVPIDYLIGSWIRASNLQRTIPAARLDEHKQYVLSEAKRFCCNYILYCLTIPDMFDGQQDVVNLAQRLIADIDSDQGLPNDVLQDLVGRMDDEPQLEEVFKLSMINLSSAVSTMDMQGDYKPYTFALQRLVHFRRLAALFVNLPQFLNFSAPARIEKETLLGPFLQISPLQKTIASTYFSGAKTKTAAAIAEAGNALRLSLRAHQDQLFAIVNSLVRSSSDTRNRVLLYFAKILNSNKMRSALQVDHRLVASDSFMLNVTAILAKLCEPFMTEDFSKIDRIDINYFCRHPKLDISEDTKINADEQESNAYYSQNAVDGENNFITEVFFLAVAAHHYGLGATENQLETLERDVPDLEKYIARLEEAIPTLTAGQRMIYERNLDRLRRQFDTASAYKLSLEAILLDDTLQARTLYFMRYLVAWLLRVVDANHDYPSNGFDLPLPDNPPRNFCNLPEYFIEDVGNCISFISHYLPDAIVPTQCEGLLVFCITFLRMTSYIRKANLKSKLVEILFFGMHPRRRGQLGYMVELLHGDAFSLRHLMGALMTFYIEIEKEYYEKFNVRYHISHIIKSIWANQAYRDTLEEESKHNVDFFVRFVALLLNDATYTLDNSLTALTEIHKLQLEIENPLSALTEEQKSEKEKTLTKAERDATSYMTLGNETIAMLKLFTAAISDSFVQPEVAYRVASMLDYNLQALVGKRCNELKVREPEKYRFRPRELLSEIADIYLNLRDKPLFLEGVAKDGRSYKPDMFDKAISIFNRLHLKSNEDIAALKRLSKQIEQVKKTTEEAEVELGEIPEEFTDPLMATLMEDPVILPASRATLDRQTIKSYLLNDPRDPFNRAPLKIEDVEPNTDLKQKIDAWVTERRAAVLAEQMDVDI